MSLQSEINRRKTFEIISHPDAGRTTMTEKLLLFGGAIQETGVKKNNKLKKMTLSVILKTEYNVSGLRV